MHLSFYHFLAVFLFVCIFCCIHRLTVSFSLGLIYNAIFRFTTLLPNVVPPSAVSLIRLHLLPPIRFVTLFNHTRGRHLSASKQQCTNWSHHLSISSLLFISTGYIITFCYMRQDYIFQYPILCFSIPLFLSIHAIDLSPPILSTSIISQCKISTFMSMRIGMCLLYTVQN